jgi:transcriptional regulator with XRE-family HTH domain
VKKATTANSVDYDGFPDRMSRAFGYLKRAEIADKLGVNYQTLTNWLNGRNEIPVSELVKVANETGCSLNWLLTGKGEIFPGGEIKEVLKGLIREVIRDERSAALTDEDIGGEVGPIEPADRIAVPHLGTFDGGEETEEVRKPRRKTG